MGTEPGMQTPIEPSKWRWRQATSWLNRHAVLMAFTLLGMVLITYLLAPAAGEQGDEAPAFRSDTEGSDGLGVFLGDLRATGFQTQTIFSSPLILYSVDPEKTLYVAIAPQRTYTDSEVKAIQDFIDEGGRVLIADDTGASRSLSQEYGVTVFQRKIWDLALLQTNSSFVGGTGTLGTTVFPLMLDSPSTLTATRAPGIEIVELARTNEGFIDSNRNGVADLGDEKSSRPILVEVAPTGGPGRVYFLSEPELLTTRLLTLDPAQVPAFTDAGIQATSQDRLFVVQLVRTILSEGGSVLIDESRHSQAPVTERSARFAGLLEHVTAGTTYTVTAGPLSADLPLNVMVLATLAVLTVLGFRLVRTSKSWVHKFHLRTNPLHGAHDVHHHEFIKEILLSFARIRSGLSEEEFNLLSTERQASYLPHSAAQKIITDQTMPSDEEMGEIMRALEGQMGIKRVLEI